MKFTELVVIIRNQNKHHYYQKCVICVRRLVNFCRLSHNLASKLIIKDTYVIFSFSNVGTFHILNGVS